jgi:hypothetical protein
MTYLVVGVDQSTFAPWHENIGARDVSDARRIAVVRARAKGVALVVAAVIGPHSSVFADPVDTPVALPRAA